MTERGQLPGRDDAVTVSVVIPTHNRAPLVVRAIRSVMAQTLRDFELIVVDDRSVDDTAAAVATLDDARLHYVRLGGKGGQSHALNEGIRRARAEWVAFLDDDDEWLPNKLEAQLARLTEVPGASAALSRCYVRTPDGLRAPRAERALPQGDITDDLLRRGFPITPSVYMVRREALASVGGFDEALQASQDWDIWLRLSEAGHRFVSLEEPLAIYHWDDDKPGVTRNAIAQLKAFRRIDRRWGPLMRARLGVEEYERWRSNRSKKLLKAHDKLLRKMEQRGDRAAAQRYLYEMWRSGPRTFVRRAIAVLLLGRLSVRLRGKRVVSREPA